MKRGADAATEIPGDVLAAVVAQPRLIETWRKRLASLRIDVEKWIRLVTKPRTFFGTAIGTKVSLAIEASRRGVKRAVGALDLFMVR